MNGNDATRIIDVIDSRVRKLTFSEAAVETTWGTVAGVASDGSTVSAYLYGETDGAYVSADFRTVNGVIPAVGDSIKVAMDKARGDRWVEEVFITTAYPKLAFDLDAGKLLVGTGAALPTFGAGSKVLKVNAGGTALEWADDNDTVYTLPSTITLTGQFESSYSGEAITASNGWLQAERAAAGTSYFIGQVTADTGPRVRLASHSGGGGAIVFSDGSVASGSEDLILYRTAANQLSLGSGDALAVAGTQVVSARRTGWGAPTGTATRTAFATDSVTLINLARAVKALVDDLTSHGLIGA
jgi:hypothetical protein